MKIEIVIECDNGSEVMLVAAALESLEFAIAEVAADETGIPVEVDPATVTAPPVTEEILAEMELREKACPSDPPKKRGRPKRAKPDEVLAQLKESVAVTPEPPSNVVPIKKPDPIEQAVFGVPDTTPAEIGAITTGQQLQDYILGFVHQKRLNPTLVKATIYPKYGVVRSLDLSADQVPLAKADVDAMLAGDKPAAAANDLDL